MKSRIVDLTMTLEEGMQTFWGYWHPMVEITQLGRLGIEKRETRKLTIGTHTGTHIDSPRHFIPGGMTVDNIPIDQLCGPATVLDLSETPDYKEVGVDELAKKLDGNDLKRLIVRFDWDLQLNTLRYYSGHPFFSEAACEWLVEKGCRLLALDTPQPDNPKNGRGCEKDAPNHKILLGAGVVIVEYLINIRDIESPTVDLVVAPLKVKEGDGAPVRCFVVENQ